MVVVGWRFLGEVRQLLSESLMWTGFLRWERVIRGPADFTAGKPAHDADSDEIETTVNNPDKRIRQGKYVKNFNELMAWN